MTEFKVITDDDLLKATLMNRCVLAANGCWIWTGSKRNGYGLIHMNGKCLSAHRVSYETFVGRIPREMVICHSCDNPSCINPDHLRSATMKENMADREARHRRDVRGEQIGTSKLTANQVLAIRASNLSNAELAEMYGVHKSNIWAIRARKFWKHLEASSGVTHGN